MGIPPVLHRFSKVQHLRLSGGRPCMAGRVARSPARATPCRASILCPSSAAERANIAVFAAQRLGSVALGTDCNPSAQPTKVRILHPPHHEVGPVTIANVSRGRSSCIRPRTACCGWLCPGRAQVVPSSGGAIDALQESPASWRPKRRVSGAACLRFHWNLSGVAEPRTLTDVSRSATAGSGSLLHDAAAP